MVGARPPRAAHFLGDQKLPDEWQKSCRQETFRLGILQTPWVLLLARVWTHSGSGEVKDPTRSTPKSFLPHPASVN